MITAQQAREMIVLNELSLQEIEDDIKMMSIAGHAFYCTSKKCIVTEQTMNRLKELGYSVELRNDPFFFKIEW